MYNEEQKGRYIEFCKGKYSEEYVNNLVYVFKRSEEIETLFGKDICTFSYEDIANFYAYVGYKDEYVYSTVNSRLGSYTDWANGEHLVPDGCNHFREFSFSDFSRYVNKRVVSQKYISKEMLDELCKTIINPRDEFLVRCLYEFGKSEFFNEIYQLRIQDIDQKARVAHLCSGREVKISKKLCDVSQIAEDTEEYYFSDGNSSYKRLVPGPYIFKKSPGFSTADTDDMSKNNKLVARVIKNILEQAGGYAGINASSLAVSGQLEMIRQRATELGIDQEEYVLEYFDELRKQYNMAPDNPKTYLRKYKAYLFK